LASEEEVEYLDVEDLVGLATRLLGSASLIRGAGLLASAAVRPRTAVFGEDAYSDLWTKAAALLQSIVKSHPLVDGNKRLGWLATATFLDLNGMPASAASNDDVYAFVMDLAAGDQGIEQIATRLQGLFL
jgi:death-on-curing protein